LQHPAQGVGPVDGEHRARLRQRVAAVAQQRLGAGRQVVERQRIGPGRIRGGRSGGISGGLRADAQQRRAGGLGFQNAAGAAVQE